MRKRRRTPKTIDADNFTKILDAIQANPYTDTPLGNYNRVRDKTVIIFMYYCGLRPKEALSLRWKDINIQDDLIAVVPYFNKERNDLPAILTSPAKKALFEYMREVKRLNIPLNEYCFPSIITGKPLNSDTFAKKFQRYVKDAGLKKFEYYDHNGRPRYSFNPYSLRHTFINDVRKKKGIDAAKEMARHKNIESTMIYTQMDFEEKKRIAKEVFG